VVELVVVVEVVDVVDVVVVVVQFKCKEWIIISTTSQTVIPVVIPAQSKSLPLYITQQDSTSLSQGWASGHTVVGQVFTSPVGQQHGKLLYEQLQLQAILYLVYYSYSCCKRTICWRQSCFTFW
jgi:hypothetical protein